MSLEGAGDKHVHYPANPDVFQFDEEVSRIFPEMAKRSIPMYHEAHRAHVAMLRPWLSKPGVKVLDVGASRGEFFRQIIEQYGRVRAEMHDISLRAIDNSQPMCQLLQADFPFAIVECADLTDPAFARRTDQYDIINVSYVIQFIDPAQQAAVLRRIASLLKRGGVLIIGQKDRPAGRVGDLAHDEYIEFRVRNGYSREEIAAKTKALKGAMWPMPYTLTRGIIEGLGFSEVVETTRWMVFSNLFCIK